MDLSKLRHIIEIHRPSKLISSLPFVTKTYEGLNIRWFVYEHKKNDNENVIEIKRIFTMDRSGRVEIEFNPGLTFKTSNIVIKSDIEEDEYYDRFIIAFNDQDKTTLQSLLERSESEEVMLIYNQISVRSIRDAF